MSPGIPEEVGQTSRAVVDVFQSSPVVFAVLLFNLLFMGSIVWMVHSGGERWERAMDHALKICQGHNLGGVEIK